MGKSTLCANLSGVLADIGLRVLMVDADLQPSLSKYYKLKKEAPKGLFEVITSQTIDADCISNTEIENLDIIVSNDTQKMLQPWLMSRLDNQDRLINALASPYFALLLEQHQPYDVVVIDTQGAEGPLQNCAALAANQILLPAVPETLAARELTRSTMEMFQRLEPTSAYKNRLGTINAIFYRHDRTQDCKEVTKSLREKFFALEGRLKLLDTMVPQAVIYKIAASAQMPAHRLAKPNDLSSLIVPELRDPNDKTTESAWRTMHRLAWELVPTIKGCYAGGDGPY